MATNAKPYFTPTVHADTNTGSMNTRIYTEDSAGDPEAKARREFSDARRRIGSTPGERAGLEKGYVPGYGRSAANNNIGGLTDATAWNKQFQPVTSQPGMIAPNPYADHNNVMERSLTPNAQSIMANPDDWRGKVGATGAPPATPRAPLYNPTQQVAMRPIPAPLTGPMGNAETDRAGFDANRAMYAPGGMTTPIPNTTANATPAMQAAAGTGQNIAAPQYGTASSTFAGQAPTIAPNAQPNPAQPSKTAGVTPAVDQTLAQRIAASKYA